MHFGITGTNESFHANQFILKSFNKFKHLVECWVSFHVEMLRQSDRKITNKMKIKEFCVNDTEKEYWIFIAK